MLCFNEVVSALLSDISFSDSPQVFADGGRWNNRRTTAPSSGFRYVAFPIIMFSIVA